MSALRMAAVAALVSAAGASQAQLSFDVMEPAFRVSIPRLPSMTMGEHPMRAGQPHLQLLGNKDAYTVSVLTPTADSGMKAVDCASSTINQLTRRPNVPAQDRIYKARIDSNTYIAIYASPMQGFLQLNAHLLSAVGGTHCVEVHASMVSTSKEDVEAWFKGFTDARIEQR